MSTLSTREQARHALLVLGVPTAPRLLVEVHTALFDGDLSVPALAALIRDEERAFTTAEPRPSYLICPGLHPDLTPARGVVTLSTWPLTQRICTPAVARAEALASVARIAEFVAVRPDASGTTLLRQLAETVPGGIEALDVLNPLALAEAARTALAGPAVPGSTVAGSTLAGSAVAGPTLAGSALAGPTVADAAAAEAPIREAAAARAAHLDERSQLFGTPTVPHQRGSE
ncbi:MAG TPA: hypothetical protein VFR35_13295 [Actinoplanes sp.]|nr:hypothetical protein [Actinoplanes sp.]